MRIDLVLDTNTPALTGHAREHLRVMKASPVGAAEPPFDASVVRRLVGSIGGPCCHSNHGIVKAAALLTSYREQMSEGWQLAWFPVGHAAICDEGHTIPRQGHTPAAYALFLSLSLPLSLSLSVCLSVSLSVSLCLSLCPCLSLSLSLSLFFFSLSLPNRQRYLLVLLVPLRALVARPPEVERRAPALRVRNHVDLLWCQEGTDPEQARNEDYADRGRPEL
jgi:hypothetical protein